MWVNFALQRTAASYPLRFLGNGSAGHNQRNSEWRAGSFVIDGFSCSLIGNFKGQDGEDPPWGDISQDRPFESLPGGVVAVFGALLAGSVGSEGHHKGEGGVKGGGELPPACPPVSWLSTPGHAQKRPLQQVRRVRHPARRRRRPAQVELSAEVAVGCGGMWVRDDADRYADKGVADHLPGAGGSNKH